jgi:hypothetical protein
MNLEKSIIEAVTTAVKEIRQESCIEKRVKSLMKIYDAIVVKDDEISTKNSLKTTRKRKRSISHE